MSHSVDPEEYKDINDILAQYVPPRHRTTQLLKLLNDIDSGVETGLSDDDEDDGWGDTEDEEEGISDSVLEARTQQYVNELQKEDTDILSSQGSYANVVREKMKHSEKCYKK